MNLWRQAAWAQARETRRQPALSQRRVDRLQRLRSRAQFALRELVERPVGRAENLVQFVALVLDVDEAGGDLAGNAGSLERGERRRPVAAIVIGVELA